MEEVNEGEDSNKLWSVCEHATPEVFPCYGKQPVLYIVAQQNCIVQGSLWLCSSG